MGLRRIPVWAEGKAMRMMLGGPLWSLAILLAW